MPIVSVYVCQPIKDVQSLYVEAPLSAFAKTIDAIQSHAEILHAAHQSGNLACVMQINNWHPRLVSKPAEVVMSSAFDLNDARLAICREFGFESFDVAQEQSRPLNQEFETCVDLALAGNLNTLEQRLSEAPELTTEASPFGHRATLLLYLAANGVEAWRQVVPANVSDVATLLLKHGADKNATANVYGGKFDVIALAESSAHPRAAGVLEDLLRAVKEST